MKLIISTTLFKDKQVIDELKNLKSSCLDGLELRLREGHFDYDEDSEIKELKKRAKKERIEIFSVHAPSGIDISSVNEWERVRSVREVEKAIVVAKRLGANYVIVHPGEERSDGDVQIKKVKRSIAEIVDFSEIWKITVLLENTQPGKIGDAPVELESILNMFDKTGIGCCLDTSHLNLLGAKMSDAISSLQKYIKEVHVSDNYGKRDDHILPFDGNIDWNDFLQGLKDIRFDGVLCFELSPVEDYSPILEKIEGIYREWMVKMSEIRE
jgi:sugar phosphate isomerase/epimerase